MNASTVYIKKIDHLLGPFLLKVCAALSRKRKSSLAINRPGQILILRPGGIGDAALLLPSIKILSQLFPEAKIDILCETRNRGIFLHSPWINKLFDYRDCKDFLSVLRIPYDLVFDTEQSHFLSTVLVSVLQSSLSVGFGTMGREEIYDIAVPYSHDEYEMRSFFKLFGSMVGGWEEKESWDPPYLFPLPEEKVKVSALLRGIERPLVCLFPGASIAQKYWPVNNWAVVVQSLWLDGFVSVLLGSTAESAMARAIEEMVGCHVVNLCSRLTLRETAVLFSKARLLISTDSGILHLGVLCDVPTVSLFGPTIEKKWGPKGDKHIVINKDLTCSPCARFAKIPPCPHGIKCLKEVTVEDVSNAALRLLDVLDGS